MRSRIRQALVRGSDAISRRLAYGRTTATMDASFYAVDGHLNAEGSNAVAHALEPQLLATPAFSGCARPGVASRS